MLFSMLSITSSAQLFWIVSGNGLEKKSYIFGTMHDAPYSMIDEVSGLNDAIMKCDITIGEVDRNDQSGQELNESDLMAPVDSTLDKLLSPEDYRIVEETVNKRLESTGVSLNELRILKPSVISILSMDTDLSELGSDTHRKSFDIEILNRAAAAGHYTMGFETIAEHHDWLINAPLIDQARWLVSKCKNYSNIEGFDEVYINQDATVQFESRTPDEGYREIMVYQRNSNWADKLDRLMPKYSCLVCVGAAHLSGEKGLLQLLRDRGYTVEPVH